LSYLERYNIRRRAIRRSILLTPAIFLALGAGWAQNTSASQTDNGSGQDTATSAQQNTPVPAFGQNAATAAPSENPPVSGLDQPSLEPEAVTRSFLAPGAILSESADSNIKGSFGSGRDSGVGGATRAMGSLTLHRIAGRYQTDLQYLGGGVFYEGVGRDPNQLHELSFAQRAAWRTGQLAFRDAVSYLPEGTFGAGSYGGAGALQSGLAGLGGGGGGAGSGGLTSGGGGAGGVFGAGQLASLGQEPRLTNSAIVDLVQSVSPRSSFTLAGSYGLSHFTNNGSGLVDSNQAVGQAGYDHTINRTDQIAVSYGIQRLRFPRSGGDSVITQTLHLIYGHRVSGHMDFLIGAGPQITLLRSPIYGSNTYVSASGNVRLRYRFTRTSVHLEYSHFNNSGSGYFLGAASDLARFSVSRSLGRVWEAGGDAGFTSSKRLGRNSNVIPATSNRYFFAGASAHRHLSRHSRLFFSYQYSRVSFNNSICITATECGKTSNRQAGAIGVEWYPRPIRLD
jgi:hypothetical protein